MSLGEKIKALREIQKLNREQLAKELGLSYWALAKYENDEREPDYKTLIVIANYFKASVDYLLGRIEEPGKFFLNEALSGLSDEAKKEILDFVAYQRQKSKK
jgi:transcriptional regulator with XRE-family HTH domain